MWPRGFPVNVRYVEIGLNLHRCGLRHHSRRVIQWILPFLWHQLLIFPYSLQLHSPPTVKLVHARVSDCFITVSWILLQSPQYQLSRHASNLSSEACVEKQFQSSGSCGRKSFAFCTSSLLSLWHSWWEAAPLAANSPKVHFMSHVFPMRVWGSNLNFFRKLTKWVINLSTKRKDRKHSSSFLFKIKALTYFANWACGLEYHLNSRVQIRYTVVIGLYTTYVILCASTGYSPSHAPCLNWSPVGAQKPDAEESGPFIFS